LKKCPSSKLKKVARIGKLSPSQEGPFQKCFLCLLKPATNHLYQGKVSLAWKR
jgi:hypothetical protein